VLSKITLAPPRALIGIARGLRGYIVLMPDAPRPSNPTHATECAVARAPGGTPTCQPAARRKRHRSHDIHPAQAGRCKSPVMKASFRAVRSHRQDTAPAAGWMGVGRCRCAGALLREASCAVRRRHSWHGVRFDGLRAHPGIKDDVSGRKARAIMRSGPWCAAFILCSTL